jgi:hypothetical protein
MVTFDSSMLDNLEDPQVREQLLNSIPSWEDEGIDARNLI